MRTIKKLNPINRRGFLEGCTGVAILAGVTGGLTSRTVLAADLTTSTPTPTPPPSPPASVATMVKMARDVYPHDRVPDLYYENAVAEIDARLARDAVTQSLLRDGVVGLDAAAMSAKGVAYVNIASEADRVEVLSTIEATPFFQKFRSEMITAFYNQEKVWALLGYEGPSAEYGGYLHRGFDDLNWLPS